MVSNKYKHKKYASKDTKKSLRLQEFIRLGHISDSDPITLMVIERGNYSECNYSAVRAVTVDSWKEISTNFMMSKIQGIELGVKSAYEMKVGVSANNVKTVEPMYVIYIKPSSRKYRSRKAN